VTGKRDGGAAIGTYMEDTAHQTQQLAGYGLALSARVRELEVALSEAVYFIEQMPCVWTELQRVKDVLDPPEKAPK